MNRRTFFLGGLALPVMPISNIPITMRSIKQSFMIDSLVQCQMIVTAHADANSAETWRRSWVGRAFESQGEWYLQSTGEQELPENLAAMPGSLHFHTYVAGAAAQEGSMQVGAFRREHIACVIRIKGKDDETMFSLAEFFASRRIPEVWELMWSDSQMRSFIPTTVTFGEPIEPDESTWF